MSDLMDECPDCEGTGVASPSQGDRWGFACAWCNGLGEVPADLTEYRSPDPAAGVIGPARRSR